VNGAMSGPETAINQQINQPISALAGQ